MACRHALLIQRPPWGELSSDPVIIRLPGASVSSSSHMELLPSGLTLRISMMHGSQAHKSGCVSRLRCQPLRDPAHLLLSSARG